MKKMVGITFGVISLFAVSVPAFAHHNAASLFSVDVTKTVKGTVKQIGYYNPHCLLVMDIPEGQGIEPGEWRMEFGTPSMLQKAGIYRDTIKPGMQITVIMHPYYQGKNGFVENTILPDGKTYAVHPKVNNDKGFVGSPNFKVGDDSAPASK